jgi:hypothetical protein
VGKYALALSFSSISCARSQSRKRHSTARRVGYWKCPQRRYTPISEIFFHLTRQVRIIGPSPPYSNSVSSQISNSSSVNPNAHPLSIPVLFDTRRLEHLVLLRASILFHLLAPSLQHGKPLPWENHSILLHSLAPGLVPFPDFMVGI